MSLRKKVRTRNQIFNIRMIMENAREFNVFLYMVFKGFKKPFDSVCRTALWEIMKKMEVNGQIISSIRELYQNQEAAVRFDRERSECFNTKKGARQGYLVSPVYFNFYLKEVRRRTADEMSWVEMRISRIYLSNLQFADDMVLIATSPKRLHALINEVDRASKEFKLEIGTSKTKIMATTNELQQLLIRCRGELLAQVDKFKYLGSIVEQKADFSYEIRAQLAAALSTFRSRTIVWKDSALNKAIKLKILKIIVWPVAVCGRESWTLRAADSKRL